MKRKFLIISILTLVISLIIFMCACDCSGEQNKSNDDQENDSSKVVRFDKDVYSVERFSVLTLNPNYKGNDTLIWSSSDESIVDVKDGIIFACQVGSAEIGVKAGEEEAKCIVAVRATTSYLSLQLSQTEVELAEGKTKSVKGSLLGVDLKEIPSQFVEFSYVSQDGNVGIIDANGIITAKSVGETRITVSSVCAGETFRENIRLIVKENVIISFYNDFDFYANSWNGIANQSQQLEVFVYQNDGRIESPALTYKVEDENIATISSTGLLTCVSGGKTKIEVSYTTDKGTEFTAWTDINVINPVIDPENEYYIPKSRTVEYVNDVEDKNGAVASTAIKITSITNDIESPTTKGFGDFRVILPTTTTQSTITVRFMISSESASGLSFRAMDSTHSGGAMEFTSMEKDVWHTVTYTYTAGMDYVGFRVCGVKDAAGIIYFDYILESDKAEEQQLAECAATLTGNYVAEFDNPYYTNLVSRGPNENYYFEGGFTSEVLDEFEGESGVLKISGVTISPWTDKAITKIELPKSHTGTYMIKFYVKNIDNNATTIDFYTAAGANSNSPPIIGKNLGSEVALDTWNVFEINTGTEGEDAIYIGNYGKSKNIEYYIAWVYDGTAKQYCASTLEDNYVAEFDNPYYTNLVSRGPNENYYFEGGFTSEVLDSFEGESGVLKITGTINKYTAKGITKIKLPKSHTGTYTIKFYVKNIDNNATTIDFYTAAGANSNSAIISKNLGSQVALDTWNIFEINTGTEGEDAIYIGNYGPDKNVEYYIAWVYDGDYIA